MSLWERLKWRFIGRCGKIILWLWHKSARITLVGMEEYQKIREQGKPVVFLVWHGRIFIVPYFFRRRNIMALVSPSRDGEIPAQIMSRWKYKILRGSSSHTVVASWKEMVKELRSGGEIIIVPDGPKGPDRQLKMGGVKLAQQTGAYLVPFSFSTNRGKKLDSWDRFLIFKPFARVVALYGTPVYVESGLTGDGLEAERRRIEQMVVALDKEADSYFT